MLNRIPNGRQLVGPDVSQLHEHRWRDARCLVEHRHPGMRAVACPKCAAAHPYYVERDDERYCLLYCRGGSTVGAVLECNLGE
jgi:hypothetical protein